MVGEFFLQIQKILEAMDGADAGIRLAESIVCPDKVDARIHGGFVVALGIAYIDSIIDAVVFHEDTDGLTLVGAGVAVAQITGDQMIHFQFSGSQLGIALLAIADNE